MMTPTAVPLANLEMNVVYGCNLKCEYCTHLGRFMKGLVPLDELLFWYRSWNTKIRPQNVRIMGGEPLLHPDLEKVIYGTREHWKEPRIELVTNGLLLPQIKTSVLTALKEIGADVTVSRHFDDPCYNPLLEAGLETLRKHGIEPHISQSHWWWMKCYRIDEQGRAAPYQSDPQKAWNICYVKNLCITLIDNRLYRCPQLGCYAYAVRKGFVPSGWEVVLDYPPLTPACTQEELEAFLRAEACEQCCICPEEFQYADMYEKINLFGFPKARKLFCGDTLDEPTSNQNPPVYAWNPGILPLERMDQPPLL